MLFLISLIWGSQFFFVSLLIEDIGAITLSAISYLLMHTVSCVAEVEINVRLFLVI